MKLQKLVGKLEDLEAIQRMFGVNPSDTPLLLELAANLNPAWLIPLKPNLEARLEREGDQTELWYELKRHPAALDELIANDLKGVQQHLQQVAKIVGNGLFDEVARTRNKLRLPNTRVPIQDLRALLCLKMLALVGQAKLFEGEHALTWLHTDQRLLQETYDWLESGSAPADELLGYIYTVFTCYPDKGRQLLTCLWPQVMAELSRLRRAFLNDRKCLTEAGDLKYFVELSLVAAMSQTRASSVVEPEEWQELCEELDFIRRQREGWFTHVTLLRLMDKVQPLYAKYF